MSGNTPTNYSGFSEKSAFILAEQGSLELVELMGATDRLNVAGLKYQAIALYRMWLEHTSSPRAYVACFNLGVMLGGDKEFAQAESMYRRALEQNPDFIAARLNLGNNLEQQGRQDEALEQWRLALTSPSIIRPENLALHLHAYNNLGRLLEIKKNYQEALAMLEKSFFLDPTQRDVLIHLVHLVQKICRWPIYTPPKGITKKAMIDGTSPLAMLAASDDPSLQLAAARKFVEHKYPEPGTEQLAPKGGYHHRKVRIGYLSSDFCLHAVSLLTVQLLELHDHNRFEIYGFCWSRQDGTSIQKRVINSMDEYIKIDGMSDREAAECIRSREIDIIIDLHGLTSGARPLILSYRPAPLQVTYLGFPGTTGLPWIDCVIADKHLIPDALVPYHTEKPLHMPHCFQSSDCNRQIGTMPSRVENGLPEDAFVFCSFNNNYKFTPELFAVWMKILKRVPGSVFWLLADNEWAKENLIKSAKKMGIKKDRLIFAPRVPPADYLARYQLADLFLDTFPFNGGTTANDALFMGLPLLTLSGRTFASRMAGSLLTNLDLPELITTSLKEYEEKAVRLAKKPTELAALKHRLQKNKESGPVFDMPIFVKDYENILVKALEDQKVAGVHDSTTLIVPSASANNEDKHLEERKCQGDTDTDMIKLFTIAYSAESLAKVENGFLVLDHMQNERSDWREYWPIRKYLLNEPLHENRYYGFFSPKFAIKTGLSHAGVVNFINSSGPDVDVFTFSPQPDMGAFFLNVFEQNDVFDAGFKNSSQELFNTIGVEVNLDALVMDSRHIVFSNFIVAKKEFWLEWLGICEKIFAICEANDTDLARSLTGETTYSGNVARKVFLIERVASILLKIRPWKFKPYDMFKCAWSALGTNRFKDEAVISDALKLAHNELGHPEYLAGFSEIRKNVFFDKK
jgi:predicted O-linked N-acetylglucosamine transferase (SPINDLY family)